MGAVANLRNISLIGPDFYPTPPWATEALLSKESFSGQVYEPCCGDGAMARVLFKAGLNVVSSDLYDWGYGTSGIDAAQLAGPVSNIVTNTPFNIAEKLLTHFLTIYQSKIALLLRLSFLESRRRYPLFVRARPSRIYVFSERLSLCPAGEVVYGGGTISYGWFIWEKDHCGDTSLDWIRPGFKHG